MKRAIGTILALAALGLLWGAEAGLASQEAPTSNTAKTSETLPAQAPAGVASNPPPSVAAVSSPTEPAAPVRNQPESAAAAAATDPALLNPGDPLVVSGPGSQPHVTLGDGGAGAARWSGPAKTARGPSAPLVPAVLALIALLPALGWVWLHRSQGKGGPASLKAALAAATRSPAGAPISAAAGSDLLGLREEVLDGLRAMKRQARAFTDALEAGRSDLETEIARAERALSLLKAERSRLDLAHAGATFPEDLIALFDTPRPAGAPAPVPSAPAPAPETPPAPALDPAWLLLEEEDAALFAAAPAAGAAAPAPAPVPGPAAGNRGGAPIGAMAVRALAASRRLGLPASAPGEAPGRRIRITELARDGHTVDDIAHDLRLGRGEVALALSRAR